MSTLWRTIMVQMFMRDLKKVSALWSVRFRVSALERFCYKGFLRNSCGTKFFVRLREVSALEDVRFHCISILTFSRDRITHNDRKHQQRCSNSFYFFISVCIFIYILLFTKILFIYDNFTYLRKFY